VRGEAEPERQSARAAREVVRQVGRVVCLVELRRSILDEHVEILGFLRVRRLADSHIAIHERTTVVRSKEPLVRVDDEAVDHLDAGEQMTRALGAQCRSAIGAVDVVPHVVGTGESADAVEVVDDADVRGARGRHHGTDTTAVGVAQGSVCFLHSLRGEATRVVDRHGDEVGIHRVDGEPHRRVRAARRHDDRSHAVVRTATALAPRPSRRDERRHVAGGATRHEHTARR